MKKTNQRSYLKLMMSTIGNSTDKCSSSSTVSGGNTLLETVDGIIQQLKSKLVEDDLFEALEQKFIHSYGIKSLLKKLDVLDAPNDVANFVVAFDPIFDQIIADFQRKYEVQAKMKLKEDTRSKE